METTDIRDISDLKKLAQARLLEISKDVDMFYETFNVDVVSGTKLEIVQGILASISLNIDL